ncbi:MAG TPA: maleylpyruvate isomerase N-terminal domain-containing protein, partial [Acidimicrobiales bacterium]|nr:maleylpyruvate isomerase N-terminal domain-containing protein [Acidimicrobiales bacterium]
VLAADAAAPFELGEDAPPESGEPGDRLAVAADELVDALRAAGGEAPCWNWSGRNATTGWLARRMALESAIHRYDGELAAAEARAIDPQLSVDGIDEFLTVHLRTDLPDVPAATLGGSLCLACTDTEDAWTVDVGGGRLRVRNDRGPASACLRGGASDLFLFVWNRVGVDGLELTGDRAVAEAWASLPH